MPDLRIIDDSVIGVTLPFGTFHTLEAIAEREGKDVREVALEMINIGLEGRRYRKQEKKRSAGFTASLKL